MSSLRMHAFSLTDWQYYCSCPKPENASCRDMTTWNMTVYGEIIWSYIHQYSNSPSSNWEPKDMKTKAGYIPLQKLKWYNHGGITDDAVPCCCFMFWKVYLDTFSSLTQNSHFIKTCNDLSIKEICNFNKNVSKGEKIGRIVNWMPGKKQHNTIPKTNFQRILSTTK